MLHRIFSVTLLFVVSATWSHAEEPGWTSLFDGKSLAGWSAQVEGEVTVKDGEIQILSKGNNLWLMHETEMADFDLRVEAMMPDDAYNSGIGFRCQPGKRIAGYQCEIDRAKSGMVYAIGSGWVWPKTAAEKTDFATKATGAFDNTKWNKFHIRCLGERIQIWINGKLITDIQDKRFKSGHVALQHHGKGGLHRFRNVQFQKLTSSTDSEE